MKLTIKLCRFFGQLLSHRLFSSTRGGRKHVRARQPFRPPAVAFTQDRWCSYHVKATFLMQLTIKLCHFFWPFSGTGFPARLWRPPDRQSPPVSRPTAVEWTPSCPTVSSAAASRRRFRDTFAGLPATRLSVRRRSTRLSPGSTETNSRRMDSFVPGHQR